MNLCSRGVIYNIFFILERAAKASTDGEAKKKDPPAAKISEEAPAETVQTASEAQPKEPEMKEPVAAVPEKKVKLKIVSPLKGVPKVEYVIYLVKSSDQVQR